MGESAIRPSVRVMKGLESWVCPRQSLVGVTQGTLQSLGKTVQDAGLQRSDLLLGGLSGPGRRSCQGGLGELVAEGPGQQGEAPAVSQPLRHGGRGAIGGQAGGPPGHDGPARAWESGASG